MAPPWTPADPDADMSRYTAAFADLTAELHEANAEIARLTDQLAICRAEQGPRIEVNARLQGERNEARAEVARLAADLLAKDATIERIWAQLQEASNQPDHNCPLEDPACDGTYCNDNPEAVERLRAAQARARRRHPAGRDFIGADLGLDDDPDAVERLRAARIQAALGRHPAGNGLPAVRNDDDSCSTCGQGMYTPGCSTSPESKDLYPHGFHTVSGGVQAAFNRRSL